MKLTLTYFGIAGRGEAARLAAVLGKIPFENQSVEFKDWGQLKPTLPLGQLPSLTIEDDNGSKTVIVQSVAIVRYLGKLGGLYPTDPVQAALVDSYIATTEDMTKIVELSLHGPVKALIAEEPWSKDDVLAIRKRLMENEQYGLPFHFKYFESALDSSDWLVGGSLTIADLLLYRVTSWIAKDILDGIPASVLDQYPNVKAHLARIQSLPEVVQFHREHPTPYNNFTYDPNSTTEA